MKINRQTALGVGINSYNHCETARKSGVARSTISMAASGTQGLSLKAARAVAEVFNNKTPVALYVESQTKAIKAKLDAGGSPAAAQRGAAGVLDEILELDKGELQSEGDILRASIEALTALLTMALQNATSDANPSRGGAKEGPKKPKAKTAQKTRDPFGRVLPEVEEDRTRDLFGRRVPTER